jgi:hypothetical protein
MKTFNIYTQYRNKCQFELSFPVDELFEVYINLRILGKKYIKKLR